MLTITRSKDFDRVFRRGQSLTTSEMVVYVLRHSRPFGRVAFCVSKKLGCAVKRNRMRRRLKEMYRLSCGKLDGRCDLIILARTPSMKAPFAQMQKKFLKIAEQLGILKTDDPD